MKSNLELTIQTADPVYVQIERFLRREILSGRIPDGTRLPATTVLAKQWRADHTAIQKAMNRLAADGLVERQRKRGTFVRQSARQSVIGILFGPNLSDESAYFARVVLKYIREQVAAMQDRNWACRVYDGLTEVKVHQDFKYSSVYQHFVADMRNYAFKGLIRLSGNFSEDPDNEPAKDIPQSQLKFDVIADYRRFTYEMIKYLHKQGRQRIVYVRTIPKSAKEFQDEEGVNDAVSELNIPNVQVLQLENVLMGGVLIEAEAYEKTLLAIDEWQKKNYWPDAILISDDIAARSVTLALARKNVAVPERLVVAALANEGIVHHYGMPVLRYEFSIQKIAKNLLEILLQRMRQENVSDLPVRVGGRILDDSGIAFQT